MAISNTNLLQSTKPFHLLLLAFITMFLMLLGSVSSADSLSFSFDRFLEHEEDLILQGDAITTGQYLQLTKVDSSGNPESNTIGRALYGSPLLLREGTKVLDFDTNFTFVITSSEHNPGDGLTFFLAAADTVIPAGSGGQNLGVFGSGVSTDKAVAVEFDTYPNIDIGDTCDKHIGIDIHTIRSSANTTWNWINGEVASARITYSSASKKLTVVTSYPNSVADTLSHEIALETVLPEWVRVGFSAASGEDTETNNVLTWSFSSHLEGNIKPILP